MDKKYFIYVVLFIFCLFSIGSFFSVIFVTNGEEATLNSLIYDVGKLIGLIGFLFLSILIISGDIARFLDKFIGIDRIIKFQRKFALMTSVFVLAHPILFIFSSGTVFNYILPDFSYLSLALGIFAFYGFIVVMSCSLIYKRISYNVWQYIHILTYVLFFFGLYHAINIGSDTNNLFIKIIFAILFFSLIIGVIYRTAYKIKQGGNKFKVKEVRWETSDTFRLILKTNKKFNFKAGQFCFLRLNKEKLYARHPFTISSSPNNEDLEFTIKLNGRFTKSASKLKKDEEVIVDGPFGIFNLQNQKKEAVFIAGGVGITPFMSILQNKLETGDNTKTTLLYGVKTEKEIIFKPRLDEIKEKWFKKVYALSKENKSGKEYEFGRITKVLLQKYVPNILGSIFYICGPKSMEKELRKDLLELGVKKENILFEDFFW